MKNESKIKVVQFHHSGPEHLDKMDKAAAFYGAKDRELILKNGVMPWNDGKHRRKFIKCRGKCINKSGEIKEDSLMFWGEYESISNVYKINYTNNQVNKKLPKYIHTPLYKDFDEYKLNPFFTLEGNKGEYLQNTDPYVFGEYFIYSNCHQGKFKVLRDLSPGTIIIMGSHVEEFCVDTILVIGEVLCKISKKNKKEILKLKEENKISPVFYNNTIKAIFNCVNEDNDCAISDEEFTIYKCATYNNPIEGMFSFFPCKKYKQNEGFARVTLKYENIINPKLAIGVKVSETSLKSNYKIWTSLKQQVLDDKQGLSLGIFAEDPKMK